MESLSSFAHLLSRIWPFYIGLPFLLVALFCETVTVAGGGYEGVLEVALAFTFIADLFLIYAVKRGGIVARTASCLCLLPTLFIVADFIRRAPYVFGRP